MKNSIVISAFFKLIRFNYSLFSAFGVLLSGLLAGDLRGFQGEYLISFAIIFLSAVGSFAFNDYFDYKVDQHNNRVDRPLVLNLIPRRTALYTGIGSLILVYLLSLFLNPLARFIVIVGVSLFYFYSIRLKRIIFVNNVLIASAYVLTLLLGTLVSNSFVEPLILYFSIIGFIVGLAMEIMIDIIDVKGDKTFQIQTLSTRFGVRSAAQISAFLYLLIVILDPLPFFVMIDSRLYLDYVFLLGILIPIVSYLLIFKDLIRNQTPKGIFDLKRRLFITMQIGSLVYLLGVLL